MLHKTILLFSTAWWLGSWSPPLLDVLADGMEQSAEATSPQGEEDEIRNNGWSPTSSHPVPRYRNNMDAPQRHCVEQWSVMDDHGEVPYPPPRS